MRFFDRYRETLASRKCRIKFSRCRQLTAERRRRLSRWEIGWEDYIRSADYNAMQYGDFFLHFSLEYSFRPRFPSFSNRSVFYIPRFFMRYFRSNSNSDRPYLSAVSRRARNYTRPAAGHVDLWHPVWRYNNFSTTRTCKKKGIFARARARKYPRAQLIADDQWLEINSVLITP